MYGPYTKEDLDAATQAAYDVVVVSRPQDFKRYAEMIAKAVLDAVTEPPINFGTNRE